MRIRDIAGSESMETMQFPIPEHTMDFFAHPSAFTCLETDVEISNATVVFWDDD